jgi:hypothetical protein
MDPLLKAIRENPLSYLAEVSLSTYGGFRAGYGHRCGTAGKPHDGQYDHREYWNYIAERFQLENAIAIADTSIVLSFSKNKEDAFHFYFALLESFLELGLPWPENKGAREEDFATLVKRMRDRPVMFSGATYFQGGFFFLVGEEKAHRDLGLQPDRDREVFQDFKAWVEARKNRAAPRPWFKIVKFWGGSDVSALGTFFDWLDEYTTEAGMPDLFRGDVDFRERIPKGGRARIPEAEK